MSLDMELLVRGYTLLSENKCTNEWLRAFMEVTRRIREDIIHTRQKRLRLCICLAMILSTIGILVGIIPFDISQLPIFCGYWLMLIAATTAVYIIKMSAISENTPVEMELCFIKGTLHNMPKGSVVVQAVATEANRNRLCVPIDFEQAHKVDDYYAVCRCKSTIVITPLRDYDTVAIVD